MGKLVLSHMGIFLLERALDQGRITLGRRPFNDIVIDNRVVSGSHAAFEQVGSEVFVSDLNSTNGTFVDGARISRRKISHGAIVEIGTYEVQYLDEQVSVRGSASMDKTVVLEPGPIAQAVQEASSFRRAPLPVAVLEPLWSDPNVAALPLTKVVTTVGKTGLQVASITKRPVGYILSQVVGSTPTLLNGAALTCHEIGLTEGDIIEVAGRQWRFRSAEAGESSIGNLRGHS